MPDQSALCSLLLLLLPISTGPPIDSARPPAWSRKASRSTPISAQSENQHQTHRHLPVNMLSCIGALVTTGSHSSSPTSSSRSLQPPGPQAMAGPYTHTVRAHGGSTELLLRAPINEPTGH